MMQAIVAQLGPIAASLNASPKTFQLYKSVQLWEHDIVQVVSYIFHVVTNKIIILLHFPKNISRI